MSGGLAFQQIGYTGHAPGVASFTDAGVSWTNRDRSIIEKIDKSEIIRMVWTVFGSKAHVVAYVTDGSYHRMDGFEPSKFDEISQFVQRSMGLALEKVAVSVARSLGDISGHCNMNMI